MRGEVQSKPVRRRLYILLTVGSLLGCVAVAAACAGALVAMHVGVVGWVWSSGHSGDPLNEVGFGATEGYAQLAWRRTVYGPVPLSPLAVRRWGGIGYAVRFDGPDKMVYRVAVTRNAAGVVGAAALVPPAAAVAVVWGRRSRRRRRAGICTVCGYDLRATPGRCPECGATAGG